MEECNTAPTVYQFTVSECAAWNVEVYWTLEHRADASVPWTDATTVINRPQGGAPIVSTQNFQWLGLDPDQPEGLTQLFVGELAEGEYRVKLMDSYGDGWA